MSKVDSSIVFNVDDEKEIERLASLPKKPCKLINLSPSGCFVVHSSGVVTCFTSTPWTSKFRKWVDLVMRSVGKENCKKIEWPGYMIFTSPNSILNEESDPEEEIKFEEEQFDFEVNFNLDFPGKELLDPVTIDELIKASEIIDG